MKGDARIHTRLRLSTLEYLEVFTTTTEIGESFFRFLPARDELIVADRLYCNPRGVAHVVDAGADVLVRFNRKSLRVLHRRNSPSTRFPCCVLFRTCASTKESCPCR